MKSTNMNQIKGTYGLGETLPETVLNTLQNRLEIETDETIISDIKGVLKKYSGKTANLGMCTWPAFQCGPSFCTSFKEIFINALKTTLRTEGKTMPQKVVTNMKKVIGELTKLGKTQSIMCLVPMAIDQAPYFRMARDAAYFLGCQKPAVIHSEFLPGLKQSNGKMSSTSNSESATLFLDMNPDLKAKMFKRHAFSGGRDTIDEHRMYGGNIKTDISYQYLTYFLESDEKLRDIAEQYTKGEMTSGQIKQIAADIITDEIKNHQKAKKQITDEDITHYFNPNRILSIGGCYNRHGIVSEEYTDYDNYGINFNRTFGLMD
jgi:tryptophanyl-tRNA synthetase